MHRSPRRISHVHRRTLTLLREGHKRPAKSRYGQHFAQCVTSYLRHQCMNGTSRVTMCCRIGSIVTCVASLDRLLREATTSHAAKSTSRRRPVSRATGDRRLSSGHGERTRPRDRVASDERRSRGGPFARGRGAHRVDRQRHRRTARQAQRAHDLRQLYTSAASRATRCPGRDLGAPRHLPYFRHRCLVPRLFHGATPKLRYPFVIERSTLRIKVGGRVRAFKGCALGERVAGMAEIDGLRVSVICTDGQPPGRASRSRASRGGPLRRADTRERKALAASCDRRLDPRSASAGSD